MNADEKCSEKNECLTTSDSKTTENNDSINQPNN
jgi:hypothetical protein